MSPKAFLLVNVALGFYNVGTIWAHEVDIFRSWKLIDSRDFHGVQNAHWRKLPYWIFAPVGISLGGSVVLIWYHPEGSPVWCIWGVVLCQLLSVVLTAACWGRWQAGLAKDPLGPASPYLEKILKTHWVRTGLISACGAILLAWSIIVTAS